MEAEALPAGLGLPLSSPRPTASPLTTRPAPVPKPVPKPVPEPATPLALAPALLRIGGAIAGLAVYGFALRTAVEHAIPGPGHALWAAALPGALALAWAVCLPALYVFWGSRQEGLTARACVDAAVEGVASTAAALASTAPMLWFFAVTAPHSRALAPMGLCFAVAGLLAGAVLFGRRLRALGGSLPWPVHVAFAALVAVSFAQFAHLTGIRWS